MFCLPSAFVEKMKTAIRDGKVNPEKLNEMTSQERHDFLSKIVGEENGKQVNLLFEQKLLLKNQERAMYDWARQITGLSDKAKAETLAKIKQTFADKTQRLYDPAQNESFLNELTADVYAKKYKTEVSLEEAQQITELAADAKHAKEELLQSGKKGYGAAKVALDNYVGALKTETVKRSLINPLKEVGISAKAGAVVENAKISANFIAENSRAIVASMDNSLWFRQGLKVLMNPRFSATWAKNFATSWADIGKTLIGGNKVGDAVLDGVKADIYERPNYLNGRYEMGKKLDIGTGEEAYPTSFPSKIPILGRFFRGSEVAYEAGAMRLRVDVADRFYAMAEKAGIDMTNKVQVGDINEVVNSMTGRGRMPVSAGGQKIINNVFFSIKFFKSNLDFLTLHEGSLSSFATRQAAMNLLSVITTTGIVLGMAKALNPDDNKDIFNPTSSNFGKIKNGNMTVDMTGGAGGIVVLAGKIVNQKSTSGTTGITTALGAGYGSQTGMDVLWSFTENKFSPMFGFLRDEIKQQTFAGGKPTIGGELGNLTTPIMIQNVSQFKSEPWAKQVLGLIADGVGLNTGVYAPTTDWGQSSSAEMGQFQTKVGDAKFKQANDSFNKQYQEWFNSVKGMDRFKNLPSDDQATVITKKKAEIKDKIFKQYGFKAKTSPKTAPLPKF